MNETTIRVLLVEDEAAHAALIRRAFASGDVRAEVTVAGSLREARERLAAASPDLMLVGLRLPDGNGLDILPEAWQEPSFPIVVLTSHGDEQAAVQAMKRGALDYVVKSVATLADLPRIVRRALGEWKHVTECRQAQASLRESRQRFKTLADMLPLTVFESDADGRLTYVNRQAFDAFGYTPKDFENGLNVLGMVAPEQRAEAAEDLAEVMAGEVYPDGKEYLARRKDGATFPALFYPAPIGASEQPVGVRGIVVDIAKRKQAEQEVRQQRRELEQILDAIVAEMWYLDREGRVVRCNAIAERAAGLTSDQLKGRTVMTAVPNWSRPELRHQQTLAVARTGRPLLGSIESFETKDGRHWARVDKVPWRNAEGQIIGVLLFVYEITEQKRTEAALRSSEQKYRTVVETAQEGIGIVDPRENIVFVNPAYAQMLGYERDELIGRNLREFTDKDEFAKYVQETEKRRAGHGSRYEVVLRHKSGQSRWFHLSASPLYDDCGSFEGTIGMLTDITEKKRAEQKLRRAERMQVEAEKLAATGRMAAQVAHEINNPLAGIKNGFQLIRDAVPPDHPDYDMVGRIEKEIDRIARIVRQMYMLRPPHLGRTVVQPIREVVDDVLLMLEPLGREHEVVAKASVPDHLAVRVPEGNLHQILHNLAANAIEASPPGASVNIAVESTDDEIKISVCDRGRGISAKVQERIFDPFFTAPKPEKGQESGMGLGLTTVRNIVDVLGGRVQLESALGQGTAFHVLLPLQLAQKEP